MTNIKSFVEDNLSAEKIINHIYRNGQFDGKIIHKQDLSILTISRALPWEFNESDLSLTSKIARNFPLIKFMIESINCGGDAHGISCVEIFFGGSQT